MGNTKHITINITLNEDTGLVEELDMVEGIYNRTEFLNDCEKPMSIRHALNWVAEDLEWDYK